MTDPENMAAAGSEEEPAGPVIRDKRLIDPETGEVRERAEQTEQSSPEAATEQPSAASADQGEHPDTVLASERLADLQRLQAEYVNYKKRVDRDREKEREAAVTRFIESLLPVLDDIQLAQQHGDLEGSPFEKIADKLVAVLDKAGVERFGEVGEPFDPSQHEALMHIEAEVPEGSEGTTIVQVMQSGYRRGDVLLRAARVAVADPQ